MQREELDKHIQFLHKYAVENNIVFRVSRSSISVEELPK